jgi:hypothetical protein
MTTALQLGFGCGNNVTDSLNNPSTVGISLSLLLDARLPHFVPSLSFTHSVYLLSFSLFLTHSLSLSHSLRLTLSLSPYLTLREKHMLIASAPAVASSSREALDIFMPEG